MLSRSPTSWKPTFGPLLDEKGCLFRVWARPEANLELILEENSGSRSVPMLLAEDGTYQARVNGVGAGARYWFKIDGAGPYPDPASRFQPLGVHGPSEVVDPKSFAWDVDNFQAPALRDLVIYELHIGTFTPRGTFLSAIEKLDSLQQLGVSAIELMPIADFAGERNWGYDGVMLYAPAHSYGAPDDLRRLIDAAHQRGIAVCLDVVYNHLGPDGAYHATFAPQFYSGKHKTPWGDGLNYDGKDREFVRAFFIESALAWLRDYHIDGLRADATDTIQDDSQPHFLTELTERAHAAARDVGRKIFLIAEDARNERKIVLPPEQGGYGFDAVWADDFHHQMRHRLAGDSDGYYRDFDGSTESIAKTVRDGWFFQGEFSQHVRHPRGTRPDGLSYESRVFCIQNHDQIGNRALGERLSSQISPAAYLAASALLLLSPEMPLLFMGQEWAAAEPFLFFTDHHEELGRLVTEGRRKEFEHFAAFADEATREKIPDPQAKETFLRSKLNWSEVHAPESARCLRWYKKLLQIRRTLLQQANFCCCSALDQKVIFLQWKSAHGGWLSAVVALEGPAKVHDPAWSSLRLTTSSEEPDYSSDPKPIFWRAKDGDLTFERPGAAIFVSGDFSLDAGNGPR